MRGTGWGGWVHRRRRWVLGGCAVVLVVAVVVAGMGGTLRNSDQFSFESGDGLRLETDQLPQSGGVSAGFVVADPRLPARLPGGGDDPAFATMVHDTFARLAADPQVKSMTSYFTATPIDKPGLISSDGHMVIVDVSLRGSFDEVRKDYRRLRALVTPPPQVTVTGFGDAAISHDFDTYLSDDLRRAELISIPLSVLLLLVVFRSLAAAVLSVVSGGLAVVTGVAGMFVLARFTDVTPYAENIVTLIGLGIAIDYSLFIVSRFREELDAGRTVEEAVGAAMSTAGRAIAFSGVTVALGLLSLLFFRGTFLVSMGLSGSIVVAVSVLLAVTFLPAVLSLLGPRINASPWRWAVAVAVLLAALALPLPGVARPVAGAVLAAAAWAGRRALGRRVAIRRAARPPHTHTRTTGAWHALATWVMRRPVTVLLPCLAFLLLLGSPFPSIHLVNGGVNQLPVAAESRRGTELLTSAFPGGNQSSSDVVVDFGASPLSPAAVGAIDDLTERLAALHAGTVVSIASAARSLDPSLRSRADVVALLSGPRAAWPPVLASIVRSDVGRTVDVVRVHSTSAWDSDAAHSEVRAIRAADSVPGARVYVTGDTAFDIDFVAFMIGHAPIAMAFAMVTTMVVLFLLLGSVLLPLKAVVMNLLSLTASFGALVWIFQQGHLSGLLGFTATPIDPTVPVLLFCIVFGLSMDYEVFLLSRMQEAWKHTRDNRAAVADGLERSGRLVSGAAAIMVCVFTAFALAQVVLIKSIGTGMAVAVLVDATIVRALVVPAVMRLMGRLNWWAPPWLARVHARLHVAERSAPPPAAPPVRDAVA